MNTNHANGKRADDPYAKARQKMVDRLRQKGISDARVLEAKKRGATRPPFPHVWAISTGKAESAIDGYGLEQMDGYPKGSTAAGTRTREGW